MDFLDITYLQKGTPNQRRAFRVLQETRILQLLAEFHPVLAGTIPLDIDLPGSDLDIICDCTSISALYGALEQHFSSFNKFRIRQALFQEQKTVIAAFENEGFIFEVFGQLIPVTSQPAYRHLLAEYRLLEAAGPPARAALRALKQAGLKTEPAFGRYFNLPGDPYAFLYDLAAAPEAQIKKIASPDRGH